MPQVHKSVITKIIQRDGNEILQISVDPIVIELNLTITSDGGVNIAAAKAATIEEEKTNWEIPSFGNKKIKFGKTAEV